MKNLYFRLARTGIRNNSRLYLPYFLACTGMVTLFYIISHLATSPLLAEMRGGTTMGTLLPFGQVVVGLFALLFQVYTNSFLMRRRRREFGLYSILGMNKGNISRILLYETLILGFGTLVIGMALGMLLSKLAELCLLRLIRYEVTFTLSVSATALWETAAVFAGVFFLLFLLNMSRVRLSNPLELLKSEAVGERPPRANWLFAVLGVILLAVAYYEAVVTVNPLDAMNTFLLAVLLVILATYLLFIAGSVTLCRLLQKNKKYYYQTKHFVSVGSMVYRMKRNGAGLASICILSTMVLVTLTATSCLYIGAEDSLMNQHPRELELQVDFHDPDLASDTQYSAYRALVKQVLGREPEHPLEYTQVYFTALLGADGDFDTGTTIANGFSKDAYTRLRSVVLLPIDFYEKSTGVSAPASGAAIVCSSGPAFPGTIFTVDGKLPLSVETSDQLPEGLNTETAVITYYIFLPDFVDYTAELIDYMAALVETRDFGFYIPSYSYYYGFDTGLDEAGQRAAFDELFPVLHESFPDSGEDLNFGASCRAESRNDFYDVYGGLLFLGVLLSAVFLVAAVLIIYYKQLSEGCEDQGRFAILQNVGMTQKEIRRSVDSQVKTVFFLPLVAAGVHLAFAFPLLWRMLEMFGFANLPLLIGGAAAVFLIFGVFYTLVYRATSNAYFRIVSAAET